MPAIAPTVLLVFISIGAFVIGTHLHHWGRPRILVRKIDSAEVSVIETNGAPDIIFQTPDGKTLLVTADLAPSSIPPLIHNLNALHIRKIDAVILTQVSTASADGISDISSRLTAAAPIVTPYSQTDNEEWWSKTKQSFVVEVLAKRLTPVSAADALPHLKTAIPNVGIDLCEAVRSPWEVPALSVRLTYRDSSIIDLCSLSEKQVAAMTGDPGTGISRLLFVDGQDSFVTKELLATVQPDIVLLSGSDLLPPGDNAEIAIQAADAQAVTLAQSPTIKITLPGSETEPLRSSVL